jgi:hypothetical protein
MGKNDSFAKKWISRNFNVVINNSIVGFDPNQDKLILQISLGRIQVIFVPNFILFIIIIKFVVKQISKTQNHGL